MVKKSDFSRFFKNKLMIIFTSILLYFTVRTLNYDSDFFYQKISSRFLDILCTAKSAVQPRGSRHTSLQQNYSSKKSKKKFLYSLLCPPWGFMILSVKTSRCSQKFKNPLFEVYGFYAKENNVLNKVIFFEFFGCIFWLELCVARTAR